MGLIGRVALTCLALSFGLAATGRADVSWQPLVSGALPAGAVTAGIEGTKMQYICRAKTGGDVIVGRFDGKKCLLTHLGQPVTTALTDVRILVATVDPVYWIAGKDGSPPPANAVLSADEVQPNGLRMNNYVCRIIQGTNRYPGKISATACLVLLGGQEVAVNTYEYVTPTPIYVQNRGQGWVSLAGRWTVCRLPAGAKNDQSETWVVKAKTVTKTVSTFPSNKATCVGAAGGTVTTTYEGAFVTDKLLNWATPTAAPSASPWGAVQPINGSVLRLTEAGKPATTVALAADFAVVPPRLYHEIKAPLPACAADAQGYGGCLVATDYFQRK
ncbi:MAG TPA: hypothetical protein VF678_05305 [bacterium]